MSNDKKDEYKEGEKGIRANVITTVPKADYGVELSHLETEIEETYQQIENALQGASMDHTNQLRDYKEKVEQIRYSINQNSN